MKYKITELPENYRQVMKIDLQKDKKAALKVNIGALIIAVILFVPALLIRGIDMGIYDETDFRMLIYKCVTLLTGCIIYVFLHEFIHGIFMRMISSVKPFYGFTGMYAYAGSKAYFNRRDYIVIALAPIVILGTVLLVFNMLLPRGWFWPVYFIQITNISGAAGDLYVSSLLGKLKPNILINDVGVSMTVYEYVKPEEDERKED